MEQTEQRTEQWFKQRMGRITASVVGAVIGCSPFMSREKLMKKMITEYQTGEIEKFDNPATEWGTFNEDGAISEFEMITGLKVEPAPFVELGEFMGASPDGYVSDGSIIEIKCPYGIRKDENPEFKSIDDLPHYYAQMQMQMAATHTNKCYFFQWAPNGNKVEVVEANGDFIANMVNECIKFYEEYLQRRETSQIFESDLMEEYLELKSQIKELQDRQKEVLNGLVTLTDGNGGEVNGHKLYKVKKDGAISYSKAVKELLPDADLEEYRGKPSEYWAVK